MSLEEKVLPRLRPTEEVKARLGKAVKDLESRTKKAAARTGLPLETMLVGSVAKGTYVGIPDIDLFVLFPPEVERGDLEKDGLRIGKDVLDGETRYAEHPYTHGKFQGFEVDLVPCYKIDDPSKLRSAVDRTPFHTRYVLGRLGFDQQDQVRLLKQFMKGIGVYGAEARVQGFSGYLTELLTLTYGDFAGVIKEASGWRPGLILSADRSKKGGGDTPMTFADPVDAKRNVASALSLDCLSLFIHACREYQKEPDERFFFPAKREVMKIGDLRKAFAVRGMSPFVVVLDRPDLVDDNLYPQVQRTLLGLRKLLEAHDFKVLAQSYVVDRDVRLVYELESSELPQGRLHIGPPAWTENAEEFLAKWRDGGLGQPFLADGRWQVYVEREFREPVTLLKQNGTKAALGNDFRELSGLLCYAKAKAFRSENRPVLTKLVDKRENWRV